MLSRKGKCRFLLNLNFLCPASFYIIVFSYSFLGIFFLSYQCTVNNKMVVCMKTLTSPFINGINNDSNTLFFIPNNSLLLVIKYVVWDSNPCRLNKLSRQKQFRRATLHELCKIITKSLKKMLLFSCCWVNGNKLWTLRVLIADYSWP